MSQTIEEQKTTDSLAGVDIPKTLSAEEQEEEEELDIVMSLSVDSFNRGSVLPRRKYKVKSRLATGIPHANTVSAMPDYERQKKIEQNALSSGRFNLRRVNAASMLF